MYQIADLREHKELEVYFDELRMQKKIMKKEIAEFKQYVEKKADEAEKRKDEIWDKVYDYVEKHNLVRPGFKRKVDRLTFDYDDRVLICNEPQETKSGITLEDILRRLT